MIRPYRLALTSFAFIALSTAACSPLGSETAGENGKLRFEYQDTNGCLFGCGLEKSALQGSLVTVKAQGSDPSVRLAARLTGGSIGTISAQRETCSCDSSTGGSSSSRSIDSTDSCGSNETKSCSVTVDIETSAAGDAKLEITDPKGNVIDRVGVHVRPAARIDTNVREGGHEVAGVFDVLAGSKVKLESTVFDGSGTEMVYARHGVSHVYGDKNVLGPDSSVIIGSTEVEDMVAGNTAGETTVTVSAPGASKVVRFRVVP